MFCFVAALQVLSWRWPKLWADDTFTLQFLITLRTEWGNQSKGMNSELEAECWNWAFSSDHRPDARQAASDRQQPARTMTWPADPDPEHLGSEWHAGNAASFTDFVPASTRQCAWWGSCW
jgi:hypothetical protein